MQISQENTCIGAFFNKVAGSHNCNFIKKRLLTQVFSSEFCQLFKKTYFVEDLWTASSETPAPLSKNTPSFTEHLQWLILTFSGFQPATLLKKRLRHRCFSLDFAKFLRTSSDRTPPDDFFSCLSVNFEKLFRWPFS